MLYTMHILSHLLDRSDGKGIFQYKKYYSKGCSNDCLYLFRDLIRLMHVAQLQV